MIYCIMGGDIMKKNIFFLLLIFLVITLCLEVGAYEYDLPNEFSKRYEYDMDIPWRQGNAYAYRSGFWGFTYNWDPGMGNTQLQSYLNMETFYNRWNKKIVGPLVEGGQRLTTVFGANLGSQYSPFVAMLDEYTVGLRISDYSLEFPNQEKISLDATYIIGYLTRPSGDLNVWKGPSLNNVQGDFVANLKGNYKGVLFNNTALRYHNKKRDEYFYNYALEAKKALFNNRLALEGIVASYQEKNDGLLILKSTLDILPGILSFGWAMHDTKISDLAPVHGPDDYLIAKPIDPDERILVNELKYLGRAIDYGPKFSFEIGNTNNLMKLNYATNARLDFFSNAPVNAPDNPRLSAILTTQYENIFLQNTLLRQVHINENRNFYRLTAIAVPEYPLPLKLKASLRFDLDYDFGYVNSNQTSVFSYLGLRLSTKQNVFRFKNVELSGIFILGLSGEDYERCDQFKYSLMAKYDAPNGMRIRLQYFNSDEFTNRLSDIFGEDRYAPYRWYRNDYGKKGLRLILALPY